MKVVCIENPSVYGDTKILKDIEVGKVYEATLIFVFDKGVVQRSYVSGSPGIPEKAASADWYNNYFNIEGFSDIEWFPTKYFTTLDEWRETQLNKLKI